MYLPANSDTNFEWWQVSISSFRSFVSFFFFFYISYENGDLTFLLFTGERLFNIIVGERYNKFSHAKNSASSQGFHVHPYRHQIKFLVYLGKFSLFEHLSLHWRNNAQQCHVGTPYWKLLKLASLFLRRRGIRNGIVINIVRTTKSSNDELVLSHTNAVSTRCFLRFPSFLNFCRLEPFDRQFYVNSINRVNRGSGWKNWRNEIKVLLVHLVTSHLESVEAKIVRISIYFACLRVAQCGRPV